MRSHCCPTSRFFLFRNTHLVCFVPHTVLNSAIHALEDSLVGWPKKVHSQVMSPEQASGRRTILVRTSQLHLCHRKRMRHTAWECCLHHCSCRREKQVQHRQAFIALLEKSSMSRSSHLRSAERRVAMHSHKRKSSRGPIKSKQESYSARE